MKGWRNTDSIDLNDVHVVAVDPEIHGSESAGVDDLHEIRIRDYSTTTC